MGKFKLVKKVDLGKFWEGAYIEFNAPTFKDLKELTAVDADNQTDSIDNAMTVLGNLFVGGKIGEDEVKKENIADLPVEVLTELFKEMSGTPDPNA